MRKKILLIVDDEKDIHELIKAYLPAKKFEIHSAYDGENGVTTYQKLMKKGKKPDLVIMDLNLSGDTKTEDLKKQFKEEGRDGVLTTQEIIDMDPYAHIIGFSAYANLEWGERLRATGVNEVVGREIGFDGFAKKILQILT